MTEHEPSPQPMDQTHDYVHTFVGLQGVPGGRCRIRIFAAAGRPPVILASELPDNTNTSITNLAEYLAPEIVTKHFPERLEEEEPAIWIEHYGPPQHRGRRGQPEFARVRFANWTPHVENRWRAGQPVRRVKFGEPEWDHLSPQEVERLIGHRIDPDTTR
jgi:hypothetical protein